MGLQGEGILQTIAELSVAFAGFTGVVVAFGRRPGRGASIDAHAFVAMLASSLQALLFSMLPFLMAAAGMTEPRLWRVGSACMLVGLALGASADLRYGWRADRSEWRGFDRGLAFVVPVLGLSAIGAQLLNVLGAVGRPFAAYLGGLLFFLTFSSGMFVRLLAASD